MNIRQEQQLGEQVCRSEKSGYPPDVSVSVFDNVQQRSRLLVGGPEFWSTTRRGGNEMAMELDRQHRIFRTIAALALGSQCVLLAVPRAYRIEAFAPDHVRAQPQDHRGVDTPCPGPRGMFMPICETL